MKNTYKSHVCPMTYVLEILGDKWTFLIIRDMLFKGCCRYKQFSESEEGVATNILADRLKKLTHHEIITQCKDPENGRQKLYHLTEKGLDLIPSILQLVKWSGHHDKDTFLTDEIKNYLDNNFEQSIEYVRSHYIKSCHNHNT